MTFRRFALCFFATTYVYTWWLSIKWFLLPLIVMYGGWTFLGMWLAILALSFTTSFAFFYLKGLPHETHQPTS